MRSVPLSILATALVAGPLAAQRFDVASVKPNVSGEVNTVSQIHPDSLEMRNQPLLNLIRFAYSLAAYQVAGPAWLKTERYDLLAKAAGPATPERLKTMLQGLLSERFGLVVHRETKVVASYRLVTGKRGLKIPPVAEAADRIAMSRRRLHAVGASMKLLSERLSQLLECPVDDATGVTGAFTFDLAFSLDPAGNSADPTLFEALAQQLGVTLEAEKRPVEILVVDHAEKTPAGN
jgi:uncharacterized protein (TIGR03435 family)